MALCKCMHCRKKVGVVLTSAPLANLVATCKILQGVMGLPSWPPSSQRRECVQSWQPHTVSMARCCLPCSRQAAWQWSQLQNRNVSLYINNAFYLFQHMQSYRTWLHNCLPELSTNVATPDTAINASPGCRAHQVGTPFQRGPRSGLPLALMEPQTVASVTQPAEEDSTELVGVGYPWVL